MKLRAIILAMLALVASGTSLSAIITGNSNVSFLAIDGQKANKSLLKQSHSFNINNNQIHQIVVRVEELVGGGEKQFLFESAPIVVTFQGTDEDLRVSAPALNNRRDAEKFQRSPAIRIVTQSGNPIEVKQEILKQDGMFPSANVIEDLAEYNADGKGIAAVPAFASAYAVAPSVPSNIQPISTAKVEKNKQNVQGENMAEQMLQYWYQQADKETKIRFLNWLKQQ